MTAAPLRLLAAAAFALGAACPAAAGTRLLSYEAIPSAQVDLDLSGATYSQRAELTLAVHDALVASIIRASGLDPADAVTELTPGGYLLETNASLQTEIVATDAEAERLAAALGYVFRQWSVLVTALDEPAGDTAFVAVGFPEGTLTPEAAQGFFEAAAAVDEGLGGGYTAFGDAMIFLNVRDAEHEPYSGLEDVEFAAKLGLAAGRHAGGALAVEAAGYADASFVSADWDEGPDGEDYAALIADPAVVAALDALRAAHDALVASKAEAFGWR